MKRDSDVTATAITAGLLGVSFAHAKALRRIARDAVAAELLSCEAVKSPACVEGPSGACIHPLHRHKGKRDV